MDEGNVASLKVLNRLHNISTQNNCVHLEQVIKLSWKLKKIFRSIKIITTEGSSSLNSRVWIFGEKK